MDWVGDILPDLDILLMKAQVSAELLVILGIALIVLTLVFSLAYESYSGAQIATDAVKARTSLKVLKNAADYVYSQGEGAGTRVFVNIPARINNSEVSGNHIKYRLNLAGNIQDVVETLDACVTGEIPYREGSYWVTVTSAGDCIRFGEIPFTVAPDKVSFSISVEDEPVEEVLTVRNHGNLNLSFTLDSTDSQLVELNQSSIEVGNNSNNSFTVTVDAQPETETGLHYEKVTVVNDSDVFTAVVTVLVQD
jgi:hypothetical protein